MEPKENYLNICKLNYLQNIRPGNPLCKEKEGYKKLIEIAQQFFENEEYHLFAEYLQEGNYLIQLWTAHLILEYGKPNVELKSLCIAEIIKYSEAILNPTISIEEKMWIENNEYKY